MSADTVANLTNALTEGLVDHSNGVIVDQRLEITALTVLANKLLEDNVPRALLAEALINVITSWQESGTRIPWQALDYFICKLKLSSKVDRECGRLSRLLKTSVGGEKPEEGSDRYFLIAAYIDSGGSLNRKFIRGEEARFRDGEPFAWLRLFVDSGLFRATEVFSTVRSYVENDLITTGQFVSLMPDLAGILGDDDLKKLILTIFRNRRKPRDIELLQDIYHSYFDEDLDGFASSPPFNSFLKGFESQIRNLTPAYSTAQFDNESIPA